MSGALAEALVAAQRRAIAALEKAYVAGHIDREHAETMLRHVGAQDSVDLERLLVSLDVIRAWGAALPAEPASNGAGATETPENATERQWAYLRKLADEKGFTAPEGPLTKDQASAIIDSLQKGSYDPAAWSVPF